MSDSRMPLTPREYRYLILYGNRVGTTSTIEAWLDYILETANESADVVEKTLAGGGVAPDSDEGGEVL